MKLTMIARDAALAASVALLAGCGSSPFSGGGGDGAAQASQADFTTALQTNENRLARPPNVISSVDDALLRIGDEDSDRLLPGVKRATLRREGTRYWLEVQSDVGVTWETVREFWRSEGFALTSELPELGIVETDWRQDRAKVLGTGLSQYLDFALERLNDTGERYRFRTRVERGERDGSSLVFISHRAIQEPGTGGGSRYTILPSDPTLEAEMLRRLLLQFRAPEESLASLEEFRDQAEVDELYVFEGGDLYILRDFDEAWPRMRQALDRSGYTVSASNRREGTFTIRIADPTLGAEELGFFDQLLGGGQDDGEPYVAVIALKSDGAGRTQVVVPEDEAGQTILEVISANI